MEMFRSYHFHSIGWKYFAPVVQDRREKFRSYFRRGEDMEISIRWNLNRQPRNIGQALYTPRPTGIHRELAS